ncbi:uncharacterized protein LOC131244098 [Magnolia sinica]|uniref:uncharacterized protein LOC131244098 n=1 Tax=Magnolia sinica TaxID=86752 RepID=UPI002658CC12|nr:uncharacterized protein LOC131244098 [Magnolia sinica]
MVNLASSLQGLWAIGDNFNAVVSVDERSGRRQPPTRSSEEFEEAIDKANLFDASFFGTRFTWCNNQAGVARSWARLDRVLINASLLVALPSFSIHHLQRECGAAHPMFNFLLKLKAVKRSLKCWNRDSFGNIFQQIKAAESMLCALESQLQFDSHQSSSPADYRASFEWTMTKLKELELKEEIYWKQKVRINWMDEGDHNTKMFHASVIEH